MDLLDVVVKIKADSSELNKKLDEAHNSISSFGSKVGGFIGGVGKVAMAGVGAAVAGVSALTKQSVAAYGEFQQLQGGVETLFGTGGKSLEQYAASMGESVDTVRESYKQLEQAEQIVMQNAKTAFNDAGLSMNQYMEQATTMSASLKQSLGGDTVAAAKYADMAIKDMSDNANKMGTNIQAIQNAYQGFSKQNYTMLDNLKLGYGGTKSEMQRLLKDAQALKAEQGELVEYSIDSYADIVDAIHTVQEATGIYGTTQAEAGETITGSLASVKAAWENVLTTIASGDDLELGNQIDNFVQSAGVALKNLIPTISNALKGVGKLIKELAPVISKELPGLLKSILPALTSAAVEMLNTAIPVLAELLPNIIATLAPALIEAFVALFAAVVENFPAIMESLSQAFDEIMNTIITSLDEAFPGAAEAIQTVLDVLEALEPIIWAVVGAWVAYKTAMMISAIIEAVTGAIAALKLATDAQTLSQALLNAATMAFPGTWIIAIIGAVVGVILYLWTTSEDFRDACGYIWEAIKGFFQQAWDVISTVLGGIVDAIVTVWDKFTGFVEFLIGEIVEDWKTFCNTLHNTFEEVANWIKDKIEKLKEWLQGLADKWVEVCDKLGIGFNSAGNKIVSKMKEMSGTAETELGGIRNKSYTWGFDMTNNMASGIESGAGRIRGAIQGLAGYIQANMGHSHPTEGPLADDYLWMPDFMDNLANGIDSNRYKVEDAIDKTVSEMAGLEEGLEASDINVNGNLTSAGFGDIIIPVYLESYQLGEAILSAQRIQDYRSGGR